MEPLDIELWHHVRQAVLEARSATDVHLAKSNAWLPRVRLPRVDQFPSGWPNLSAPSPFPTQDGPVDLSALFALEKDTLHPIAYSDVPALDALVAYVLGRDDLLEILALPPSQETDETNKDDVRRRFLVHEAADLALSLLDRAAALGAEGDDNLLAAYCERERSLLLTELPAELVVPLPLAHLNLEETLVVSDRIRVERMQDSIQAVRAQSTSAVDTVPEPVVSAATHMIVVSGVSVHNRPRWQRVWRGRTEGLPFEEVDLVCEALRIVTERPIGYAQVLLRPLGWADSWTHDLPPLMLVATLRRYPAAFDDYAWLRPALPIDADALRQLPAVFAGIAEAAPRVRLASRRLSSASLRSEPGSAVDLACGSLT